MAKFVTLAAIHAAAVMFGIKPNGSDTLSGEARADWLSEQNNGAWLRCSVKPVGRCKACTGCEAHRKRGIASGAIAALVRTGSPDAILPLAQAREAYRAGKLTGFVTSPEIITGGAAASACNMALDREAKHYGADGFTVRCFADGDKIVAYIGKPKGS